MREQYRVESEFETAPTDAAADEMLARVMDQMTDDEQFTGTPTRGDRATSAFAERGDTTYRVTLEAPYGSQTDGFIIEVAVDGDSGETTNTVRDVLQSAERAINRVFTVNRRLT
jgi:hypothetical protein